MAYFKNASTKSKALSAQIEKKWNQASNERVKLKNEQKRISELLKTKSEDHLQRLIKLESFEHVYGLKVENLIEERREIKRQV